jgi:hypothetical protein
MYRIGKKELKGKLGYYMGQVKKGEHITGDRPRAPHSSHRAYWARRGNGKAGRVN